MTRISRWRGIFHRRKMRLTVSCSASDTTGALTKLPGGVEPHVSWALAKSKSYSVSATGFPARAYPYTHPTACSPDAEQLNDTFFTSS
jgi:hypothetical protein